MFGKKKKTDVKINHSMSCGKFGYHAKLAEDLLNEWFPDKLNIVLFPLDNVPADREAFEMSVNGTLIHSQKKQNHGYLDSAPEEHKMAVKTCIELAIKGNRIGILPETEYSQIAEETQKAADKKKAEEEEKERKIQEKKDAEEAKRQAAVEAEKAKQEAEKQKKAEAEAKKKRAAEAKKKAAAEAKKKAEDKKREEEAAAKKAEEEAAALKAEAEAAALKAEAEAAALKAEAEAAALKAEAEAAAQKAEAEAAAQKAEAAGFFAFACCRRPADLSKFDATGDTKKMQVGEDEVAMDETVMGA